MPFPLFIRDPWSAYFFGPFCISTELIPCSAKPEWTAVPVSAMTAVGALELVGHIKQGQTVLVTAAAGGTGHVALQWAKGACTYEVHNFFRFLDPLVHIWHLVTYSSAR